MIQRIIQFQAAAQRSSRLREGLCQITLVLFRLVKTRVLDSGRNRPTSLRGEPVEETPERQAILADFREKVANGLTPQQVADDVFRAIREKQLYVFTDTEYESAVQGRMESILRSFDRL